MAEALTRLRNGPVVVTTDQKPLSIEDRGLLSGDGAFTRGMRGAAAGLRAGSLARDELDALIEGDYERVVQTKRKRDKASRKGAAFGPRVTSLKDIHSVSDAAEFAAGAAGQGLVTTAPAVAGSVGTALALKFGLGRALAPGAKNLISKLPERLQGYAKGLASAPGGAVASIPMEAGEAANELLNDPVARENMTPQQLQELATTKGLATASLEAIVPSLAVGKVVNRSVGRRTLRGAAASGGGTVVQEGLTEGSQNLIAQNLYKLANPDRKIDIQNLLDETVSGAIGGGGLALPGVALDATQAIQQRSTSALGTAGKEVIDLAKNSPLGKLSIGQLDDETSDWLLGADSLPDDMANATDEEKAAYVENEDMKRDNFVVLYLANLLESDTAGKTRTEEAQRLMDAIQSGEDPNAALEAREQIVQWNGVDNAVDRVVGIVDDAKDFVKGLVDGPKKTRSSEQGVTLDTVERSAASQKRRRTLIEQALTFYARTSPKKVPVDKVSEAMSMLAAGEFNEEQAPIAKRELTAILGGGFTETLDAFKELHDAESTSETQGFGATEEIVEETSDFDKKQAEKDAAPPEFYGKTEGKVTVFDSAFGTQHEERVREKLDTEKAGLNVQTVSLVNYAKETGKDIIALANTFGKNRTDPEITTQAEAKQALSGKHVLRLTEKVDKLDLVFTEDDVRKIKRDDTTTFDKDTKKRTPLLGKDGVIFFTPTKGKPFAINAHKLIFAIRGRDSRHGVTTKKAPSAEDRLLAGVVSVLGSPGVNSRVAPFIYKSDGTTQSFDKQIPDELRITSKSATVGQKTAAKKKAASKRVAARKEAGVTPKQNVRDERKIEKERKQLIEQAETLPFEAEKGQTTDKLLAKVTKLTKERGSNIGRAVMATKVLPQLERIVETRKSDVVKLTPTTTTNRGEIDETGRIVKTDTDTATQEQESASVVADELGAKDVAFRARTELTNVVRPPTRAVKIRGGFEKAWLTATAAVVYPEGHALHPAKVPASQADILKVVSGLYKKTNDERRINELYNLQGLTRSNIREIQDAAVARIVEVMRYTPDEFVAGFRGSSIEAIRTAANRFSFLKKSRQSRESSPGPTTGDPATPAQVREAEEYIHKVLGPKIATEYVQEFGKSGEWQEGETVNIIRLSIGAGANMLNVARHEAMHELFARLTKTGKSRKETIEVLMNAANSPAMVATLNRLLRGDSNAKARAQIADGAETAAEERLSYMYQFWAAGDLSLGPKTETMFQKIAAFLRKITGMLTNDEKAMHIVQAFHDGRLSTPSAAGQVLSRLNTDKGLQKALKKIKPVLDFGRDVAYTSDAILRESGNSVLNELASRFNTPGTSTGEKSGYLNAKPQQISHWLNRFNSIIAKLNNEDLTLLHKALQTNSLPGYPAGDKAFKKIHAMLSGTQRESGKGDRSFLQYMHDAGMTVGRRKGYYPVVWNAQVIMSRANEFKTLMLKHHTKDLSAIAVASNEEAARQAAARGEVVPKSELATAESVADNIVSTLANDRGVPDLAENSRRIGYSPHTIAIHKRKLDFLNRDIFGQFEHSDIISTLSTYLVEGVKHAEYAKRFGSKTRNAESDKPGGTNMDDMVNRATKEETKKFGEEQAAKNMARYRKAIMAMEGTLGGDMSPRARQLNSTMLVYQNLRLLPLALFASFVDPMGLVVRGASVQQGFDAFKRGLREVAASYKKEGSVRDSAARLAERLGTVDQSIFLDTLGETYSSMYMTGWQKNLSDKIFRFNGMEGWNRGMRISATHTAIDFIKAHAANPGENSVRWLKELGITAADVKLSDDGALKMFEEDGLSIGESEKMNSAISRFVDSAILRPNASQRPAWASDPHYALLFHLKQFTYSFQKVILSRAFHEWNHGNPNAVLALSSYIPFMIAADIIKGMLVSGGDEPDYKKRWGVGDYVWSGVERAGILGVGQFAMDTYQHGPEALSGPAFEQVIDLVSDPAERSFVRALPANALYRGALQ